MRARAQDERGNKPIRIGHQCRRVGIKILRKKGSQRKRRRRKRDVFTLLQFLRRHEKQDLTLWRAFFATVWKACSTLMESLALVSK